MKPLKNLVVDPAFQAGTLNFVEFLLKKVIDDACRDEDRQWFHFSMESALKDMEDEPLVYSETDLKERFQRSDPAIFSFFPSSCVTHKAAGAFSRRSCCLPGSRRR